MEIESTVKSTDHRVKYHCSTARSRHSALPALPALPAAAVPPDHEEPRNGNYTASTLNSAVNTLPEYCCLWRPQGCCQTAVQNWSLSSLDRHMRVAPPKRAQNLADAWCCVSRRRRNSSESQTHPRWARRSVVARRRTIHSWEKREWKVYRRSVEHPVHARVGASKLQYVRHLTAECLRSSYE